MPGCCADLPFPPGRQQAFHGVRFQLVLMVVQKTKSVELSCPVQHFLFLAEVVFTPFLAGLSSSSSSKSSSSSSSSFFEGFGDAFFAAFFSESEFMFPAVFFALSGFSAIVLQDYCCKISAKFLIRQI